MQEEVLLGDKRLILIGTAHISQESIQEVEQVIRDIRPDTVCVELCASRYQALQNQDRWKEMDIVKVIKQGKAPLLMANLALTAFQKKMGDQLGVKPGAEMIRALEVTAEIGAQAELADRDVTITLKRAWGALGFFEKIKLMGQMLAGLFDQTEISAEEVEQLKQKDMLTEAIAGLAKELPGIKKALIDERDRYLSTKIAQAPGQCIVAVVGAGHLPGILAHLEDPADLAELEKLPPPSPWTGVLKWGLPALIFGIVAYGFWGIGGQVSMEMIKRWVLINGILAGAGAAIAGGHILTIVSAFVAAPITSLNPTIAAGWVSGLTEAWVRKPTVQDFENLSQDITSFKGFRQNEITKILLVVVLSNLGSSLGTFLGIPLLASLL